MITDRSFSNMFNRTDAEFRNYANKVHTARWQGQDISKRPDMVSYELLNWRCDIGMDFLTQFGIGTVRAEWSNEALLFELANIIKPNLPWADDHFLERIGGDPLNPGVQWANWPWASSADRHRADPHKDWDGKGPHPSHLSVRSSDASTFDSICDDCGATDQVPGGWGKLTKPCSANPEVVPQFNHTYMERLWPKWAGQSQHAHPYEDGEEVPPNRGIRHEYGDLKDLVDLLAHEPDTRQAWIPLFFPEDTGVGDGGRKPCTLGYQIIVRDKAASIYYPLRSCDYVRHFRDDIYLAIRLLLWVIDRCAEINPAFWRDVVPGQYAMHCTSLHVFENDYRQMMK